MLCFFLVRVLVSGVLGGRGDVVHSGVVLENMGNSYTLPTTSTLFTLHIVP